MARVRARHQGVRLLKGVLIAALVSLTGAGCAVQTHTVTQVATSQAQVPTASSSSGAGSTTTTATHQNLSVGDSTTLSGNSGETIKVTLTGVQDPANGGSIDQPDPGNRYVGIELSMSNVGNVDYSDSPSNGSALVDSTGQQHNSDITTGGSCDSPGSLNIIPGNTERLCVPFQVPDNAGARLFQFTLSSGFADQTAQWAASGSTSSGAQSQSSTAQPSSAQDPASVIRAHLDEINAGKYQAAFDLMAPSYQAQNPSWPSDRAAADPGLTIVSIGGPSYGSGTAEVPVDFYARDRRSRPGSDTRCREFHGTAQLVSVGGGWRYNPGGSSLASTVVPLSDSHCPS